MSDLPKGEKPLLWCLRNQKVNEQAYIQWAKEHYQLPTIKKDFFNKSVDFDLVEKFSDLHAWSSDCYPIHTWNNTLFVACLEPLQFQTDQQIHFVIAPFSAMEQAWQNYHKNRSPKSFSLEEQEQTNPDSSLALSEQTNPNSSLTLSEQTNPDFSPTPSEKTNPHSSLTLNEQTNPNSSLTLSEQTNPESQPQQNAASNNSVSSKHQSFHAKETKQPEANKPNNDHSVFSFKEKAAFFKPQMEHKREDKRSTDNSLKKEQSTNSVQTPSKNLITEEDLSKATDINQCTNIKQIINYIFCYLKEDYKDLMWMELSGEDHYLPRFIYGDWKMTDLAWKKHVNVTDPNIFRIVHNSKLAFHGQIYDNDYNKQYYLWYTNNKKPNFATIYPVCYNNVVYGLIVAFNRSSEFDEILSLKKIENLTSICEKQFLKAHNNPGVA